MTRLRRAASLTSEDAALLAHAFLLLLHTRLAALTLPWPLFLRIVHRAPPRSRGSCRATRIEWAVRAASRSVPGANCLTQALALRRLLGRHGHPSALHIGVAADGGRFDAHAWVESGGRLLLCNDAQRARYSQLLSWSDAERHHFP